MQISLALNQAMVVAVELIFVHQVCIKMVVVVVNDDKVGRCRRQKRIMMELAAGRRQAVLRANFSDFRLILFLVEKLWS